MAIRGWWHQPKSIVVESIETEISGFSALIFWIRKSFSSNILATKVNMTKFKADAWKISRYNKQKHRLTIIKTKGSETKRLAIAIFPKLLLTSKQILPADNEINNSVTTKTKKLSTLVWKPTKKYAIHENRRMGTSLSGMTSHTTLDMKKEEQR